MPRRQSDRIAILKQKARSAAETRSVVSRRQELMERRRAWWTQLGKMAEPRFSLPPESTNSTADRTIIDRSDHISQNGHTDASNTVWSHPSSPQIIVLSGEDSHASAAEVSWTDYGPHSVSPSNEYQIVDVPDLPSPSQSPRSDSDRVRRIPSESEKSRAILKASKHRLDDEVTYQSEEQREALDRIMENNDRVLVVILRAPIEKFLLFSSPACLEQSGITIIIMPFRYQIVELSKAIEDIGIKCTEWRPLAMTSSPVVVISVESICEEFYDYILREAQDQLLKRIIVDDCHLAIQSHPWRPASLNLEELQDLHVPLILLTNTLPLWMETELEMTMKQRQTVSYIRSNPIKPNLRYSIRNDIMNGQLINNTIDGTRKILASLPHTAKIVIYCRTNEQCQQVAKGLQCYYFQPRWGVENAFVQAWATNGGCIVARSGSGCALKADNIELTVHCGLPMGLLDYALESEAATQFTMASHSLILLEQGWLAEVNTMNHHSGKQNNEDESSLLDFITTQRCRRLVLNKYFGGGRDDDCSRGDKLLCDRCQATHDG